MGIKAMCGPAPVTGMQGARLPRQAARSPLAFGRPHRHHRQRVLNTPRAAAKDKSEDGKDSEAPKPPKTTEFESASGARPAEPEYQSILSTQQPFLTSCGIKPRRIDLAASHILANVTQHISGLDT